MLFTHNPYTARCCKLKLATLGQPSTTACDILPCSDGQYTQQMHKWFHHPTGLCMALFFFAMEASITNGIDCAAHKTCRSQVLSSVLQFAPPGNAETGCMFSGPDASWWRLTASCVLFAHMLLTVHSSFYHHMDANWSDHIKPVDLAWHCLHLTSVCLQR